MSNRKLWKMRTTRKRILNEIANIISLYSYPDESNCPDCLYDPESQSSVDINCETCSGTGKILGTPTITRIKGNLRNLKGESIIRRDLGNVTSDLYLLYCDAVYVDAIRAAKYIKIEDVYYESWLNDTGNPTIRFIRTMNEQDRIEITLKRREGEDY